ncbi:MAG TPA: cache domain-containing protein, partial [Dehalococcoidia bacterium]|nr:cache domain-containing protein [Dehalococcoidia bacterium]
MVFLVLILLVPLLVVDAGHQYTVFHERRADELSHNLEAARAAATIFEAYVQDLLHQEGAIGVALTSQGPRSFDQANLLLIATAREYPSIRYYGWVDPQGRVVSASRAEAVGLDIGDRTHFRDIAGGREWTIGDLYQEQTDAEPAFVIARGFRDDRGLLKGVVLAVVDPRRLDSVLAVERPGRGAIAIIDREGRGVYRYPGLEWGWTERGRVAPPAFIATALAGQEASGTYPDPDDGRTQMAGVTPVRDTGWAALAWRPEQEVLDPIFRDIFRESWLTLLVAAVALLAAVTVARSISAPLRRLRGHALALGRGDLDQGVKVAGPDELVELAEALNRMGRELRVREDALAERTRLAMLGADVGAALAGGQTLREILQDCCQAIVRRLHGAFARIWTLNERENMLELQASAGIYTHIDGEHSRMAIDSRGMVAVVARDRRPHLTNAVIGDPLITDQEWAKREGMVAFAGHPLVVEDRLVGVMAMFSRKPLTDTTLAALASVADHIAVGIERKRVEEARARAERLREGYIHTVSHDLRNPLTVVIAQAQSLQQSLSKVGRRKHEAQGAGDILTAARRMNAMIQDLVDSARLESGQLQLDARPVDLKSFLSDLLGRFAHIMDVRRVELEVSPALPAVEADQ